MPLYSLIALVLSLFGAAYTAISALRGRFDPMIADALRVVDEQVAVVKVAGEASLQNAEKHGRTVRFWGAVWKWSHTVPIVAFWVFALVISLFCLNSWEMVTRGPLPAATTGNAGPDPFWSECCRYGRWVLVGAVVVNVVCSLGAIVSGLRVRNTGAALKNLRDCAEGVMANSQIQPVTPAAPVPAGGRPLVVAAPGR